MPLIYVDNGYPNKNLKKKFLVGGHWLPLYMHVPIWEQPSIPRKSSEWRKNFIISLALFDLPQSVSSNCSPKWRWTHGCKSQVGVARGWGGGWTPLPPKKFAQTRKKLKKLYISVFSNCSHKVGVEHGHEYRGKGVGEGVFAPKHKNAFSIRGYVEPRYRKFKQWSLIIIKELALVGWSAVE